MNLKGLSKGLTTFWELFPIGTKAIKLQARLPKYKDAILTKPGTTPWYFNNELISSIKSPKGGKVKHKFYTDLGSEYIMTDDGYARRIKTAHDNTKGLDQGLHDWNKGRTIFVDSNADDFAGRLQLIADEPFGIVTHGNKLYFARNNNGLWKYIKSEDIFPNQVKHEILLPGIFSLPYSETPQLGHSIFEFGTDANGFVNWRHPGSEVSYIEQLPLFKLGGKLKLIKKVK